PSSKPTGPPHRKISKRFYTAWTQSGQQLIYRKSAISIHPLFHVIEIRPGSVVRDQYFRHNGRWRQNQLRP
ncbi:MAG: hypothetical protein QF450_11775, partial [Rhodospirillales bacterium]|nr:hypothetical protein [Rhodospirillales bacterium]